MADKKHFLYKLIPPRPTFHMDMNAHEKDVMTTHQGYWVTLIEQRTAVIYGPVFDPTGVWGMGVIEASTDEDAVSVANNDPAVSSGTCTYQLIPMQVGLIRS